MRMPDETPWDHSDDECGYPWDCDLTYPLEYPEEDDDED